MLLAIDVGNTNIDLGVFAPDDDLLGDWRWATDPARMADEFGVLLTAHLRDAGLERAAIDGVVVASVVPALTNTFRDLARRYLRCEALVVHGALRTDVPLAVDMPDEVGADRIANALAVKRRHGAPAVVVDFGTATNFDVVSSSGEFLGGAIAPGLLTSLEGLANRAARLRSVEIRAPASAIGRNTADCMRAGLVLGYVGLVEGLVARISAELGERPIVVATGGLAPIVVDQTKVIDVYDEHLTLHGLRFLYALNQPEAPDGRERAVLRGLRSED